jgi:hypothetical protein
MEAKEGLQSSDILNILSRLDSIHQDLVQDIPDNRFWEPDETCVPFQLSAHTAIAFGVIFEFRVPTGQVAVITEMQFENNTVAATKGVNRVILTEDMMDFTNLASAVQVDLIGSLQAVLENSAGTPGATIQGIAIGNPGSGPRQVRVKLQGGHTYRFQTNTASAVTIYANISGYCYPAKPK